MDNEESLALIVQKRERMNELQKRSINSKKKQINAAIDLLKKEVCENTIVDEIVHCGGNCCMYIYLWEKIE